MATGCNEIRDLLREYAALEKHSPGAAKCMRRAADEISRLRGFEQAFNLWMQKTEWVQESDDWSFPALGLHRADIMKREIDLLRSKIAAIQAILGKPQ